MTLVPRSAGRSGRGSSARDLSAVGGVLAALVLLLILSSASDVGAWARSGSPTRGEVGEMAREPASSGATPPGGHLSGTLNATGNLTAALSRAILLVGLAAGAVVTLVWSRVAISWFSHDPSRKVQAKERARDAAIGSLVLVAAVSGLAWGLARFVLTGT